MNTQAPPADQQKNADFIFKNLFLAVFIIVLVYIPIYYSLNAKSSAAFLFFGLLFFEPLIGLLHFFKKSDAAKLTFIVSCNYFIYSTSLGNSNNTNNEYYCLPAMMLGLLLFRSNQKALITFGISLPIITWSLISWGNFIRLPADWVAPKNFPISMIVHINFIGSSTIMTVFLIIFMRATNKMYATSLRSARSDLDLAVENEAKLKLVFDSLIEGIVVQKSDGQIIQFNMHALEILGLDEDQLFGRTSMDPLWRATKEDGSPFPGEEHPAMIALKTGKDIKGVVMGLQTRDNASKWIRINATPFSALDKIDDHDDQKRVLVTFSDITDMVNATTQLEEFFETSPDLMCIAGTDGYFKRINPSFTRILGYDENELLSQSFISFVHPDDVAATLNEVEKLNKGIVTLHFKNRYRTKSGAFRNLDWVTQPDVKTGMLYAIARDITDDLKAQKNFSETILALNNSAIVAFTDREGKIIEVNEKFCEISEYSRSELIGQDHRIVNSGLHSKEFFKKLWSTISSGKVWTGEIRNRSKSGKLYWVQTVITPLTDASGLIEKYLAVRFDITAEKTAQDENRFVLDALQIGVWKFNPQTQALEWDKSMYRLFDINEEDFSGHYEAWESTLTPEAKEKAVEELHLALIGEKEFNTVFEIQNKSGNKRFIAGRAKVIRDETGNPNMMYGINYDVTKEVTTEKHLKDVTENSPGLICQFLMRPDGSTTMPYVVTEGLKMFDLEKSDYERDNNIIMSMVHPDELAMLINAIKESADNLTPFSWTGKFITKLGLTIWCSIKSTPQKFTDGSTLWSGFILDVTKEKSLEADLTAERAKALHSAKLASLGEMSAGIAHEINNPLAIISGTIPLLPKFRDDPVKYDAKVETLVKSVDRITKIVKGLRKFSRSTEGSIYKPEILADIVLETITLTDTKAKRYSVSVEADLSSKAKILCDEVEIEQVIINLINNAIDAVKDFDEKWVKLKVIEYTNEMVLRVYDSGKGIPHDVEEKLFNPFFTTKPVGEGTGLGLSISKGIIEQHKGTLKLKKDEINTCFEVRFNKHDEKSGNH